MAVFGEEYLHYFFAQIEWGKRERKTLSALQAFAETVPEAGLRYEWRDYPAAAGTDFALRMELYWRELFNRVHFASVIAQLRANAWFNGVLSGVRSQNFHAFAACLRGLIESIADFNYSLNWIPAHLESKRQRITEALDCKANIRLYEDYLDDKLESSLIHFSHAKKVRKAEAVPDPVKHKAKTITEYLSVLIGNEGDILRQVYDELCQFSHPASQSSLPFTLIHQDEPKISIYGVRNDLSFAYLIGFSTRHKSIFPVVAQLSVDPPRSCLDALASYNFTVN